MTDVTPTTDNAEPAPAEESEPEPDRLVVPRIRRTRRALWIAVAVAVPVTLLVVALANGQPAVQRQANTPLLSKPAPPIEGTTVDGGQASLTDLKGKWVVVNFFATWCVPCRQEHPELVNFAAGHKTAGDVAVLAVVYSDNAQAVKEFRDQNGGDWPMLTDPKGRIALDYGVSGVPESFLISPDGLVAAKLVGGVRADDLDRLLNRAKTGQ